jgi:molybdopterin-containing oxidoreductase family membrane subunit
MTQITGAEQKDLQTSGMLMARKRPGMTLWYVFLFLLMGLGAVALWYRISQGLAATNLTSTMPWGAWVAFYIYFAGISAGAFLFSSLIHVFGMEHLEKVGKDATLIALISMVLALCFILLDLGRMERFWHALWYGNISSVLAYEVRFYTVYILLLLAELYFALRYALVVQAQGQGFKAKLARLLKLGSTDLTEKGRQKDRHLLKILSSIGIPIAIFGVRGGTGLLFAVVKARPYWNTALFPVIFVVSALVSGSALLTAVYILKGRFTGRKIDLSLVQSMAGWMMLFLLIDVGLQFFEIAVGAYGLEEHELATLAAIFTSNFSWSFWGVQMGIGVLLPLLLYFNPRTRKSSNALLLAALAVVVGILGVRFNIVIPALTVPVLPDLPQGYYYPTWVEWLSSFGIIGMGLMLYTLAVRYLPVDSEVN